jgi:hypothetical protein
MVTTAAFLATAAGAALSALLICSASEAAAFAGHLGVSALASKVRLKDAIPKISNLAVFLDCMMSHPL